MLAMEQGEIDGVCGLDVSSLNSMRPTWIQNHEVNLLVQAALEPRLDLLEMGVPSLWDYITGDNRKTAEIVVAQQEFQRPFIAPPKMPAEALAILRKAFMEALADPATLAEARKNQLDDQSEGRRGRRSSGQAALCLSARADRTPSQGANPRAGLHRHRAKLCGCGRSLSSLRLYGFGRSGIDRRNCGLLIPLVDNLVPPDPVDLAADVAFAGIDRLLHLRRVLHMPEVHVGE